jgi:hypothetical protein
MTRGHEGHRSATQGKGNYVATRRVDIGRRSAFVERWIAKIVVAFDYSYYFFDPTKFVRPFLTAGDEHSVPQAMDRLNLARMSNLVDTFPL